MSKNIKLEMCAWDTDASVVAKFAYSHKTKAKDIFMNKGQSLWKPQDDMDHFDTPARHSHVKHCV